MAGMDPRGRSTGGVGPTAGSGGGLCRPGSRPGDYPISRWYLAPAAGWLAARLARTAIRPWHVTLAGLACGASGAVLLAVRPDAAGWAAVLVMAAWFCDRTDGRLARLQGAVSGWGGWLDGNVDELLDVGWHVAVAAAASSTSSSVWPWYLVVGFLGGKYLFFHGLASEGQAVGCAPSFRRSANSVIRTVYHVPANADVRVHLLVAALLTGWLVPELAALAVYYNVRWLARYGLVARRFGGMAAAGTRSGCDPMAAEVGKTAPAGRLTAGEPRGEAV